MAAIEEFDAIEIAGETQEQQPAKPKRKRAAKKAKPGSGVVIVGDNFLDSYTGQLTKKAIFIPAFDEVAFQSVPTALRWLEENVKKENFDPIADSLCEAYGQARSNVIAVPDRKQLKDFGGTLTFPEFYAPFVRWDELTERSGITTEQFRKKGVPSAAKKTKAGITFEAGTYSIGAGKNAKRVEGEGSKLSTLSAFKKLTTWQKKNTEASAQAIFFGKDGVDVIALVPAGPYDPKVVNNTATQLVGVTVVGPAVGVFHRRRALAL